MKIGEDLRKLRLKYGYTQSQIAELSNINEKYYGRIERNESNPTVEILEKICSIFNLSPIFVLHSLISKHKVERSYPKTIDSCYCNCCGNNFTYTIKIKECPTCGCNIESGYIDLPLNKEKK